jgi:AcrR family transcriptional regulator
MCQVIDEQRRTLKSGSRRPYRLRARAKSQQRTRRRIVEAAVHLHESIGPLATSVSELARTAGVTRLTVYRHFPDEEALFAACTGLFLFRHPPPDLEAWGRVSNPWRRLERGLPELYSWWRRVAPMARSVLRDAQRAPDRIGLGFARLEARAEGLLVERFGRRGRLFRAALRHAVRFWTWDALTDSGALPDKAAAALGLALVRAAAGRWK